MLAGRASFSCLHHPIRKKYIMNFHKIIILVTLNIQDVTANWKGEEFLYEGDLDLWGMNGVGDVCTGHLHDCCRQQGDQDLILSPVMSARMRTYDNFQFR